MQHRKVYLDDWSLLEKICLVSAVYRLGENNWSSVCDLLKSQLQEERQWDWFTVETCESQYKQLYNEYVKSHVTNEKPVFQIIRSLKAKCRIEGQPAEEQRKKYMNLRKILESIAKNEISEEHLDKYYERAQQGILEKEENNRKYQELLKKRDTLKTEFEKANSKSPNKPESKDGASPLTTSPLLSSLLNNPPAVQYRPTLSTSSFVATKTTQSTSRTSTADKIPSADVSFKDTLIPDLDPSNSAERQSVLSTSSAARRLDFQDQPSTSSTLPRNVSIKEPAPSKEVSTSASVSKNDQQNLENLGLISPNEEGYLNVVDIPQEELLEVIDKLKEGTILDKLIRDLEGGDAAVVEKEEANAPSLEAVAATETLKPSAESRPITYITVAHSRVEPNQSLPEVTEVKNVTQEQNVVLESTSEDIQELTVTNLERTSIDRTNTEIVVPSPGIEAEDEFAVGKKHETVVSIDAKTNKEQEKGAKTTYLELVTSVEENNKKNSCETAKPMNISKAPGSQESRGEIENLQNETVSEGGDEQSCIKSDVLQPIELKNEVPDFPGQSVSNEKLPKTLDNKLLTTVSSSEELTPAGELHKTGQATNDEMEEKVFDEEKEKEADKHVEIKNISTENENVHTRPKMATDQQLLDRGHSAQLVPESVAENEKQSEVGKEKLMSEEVPTNQVPNVPVEKKDTPEPEELDKQDSSLKPNVLEPVTRNQVHELEEKLVPEEPKDTATHSKLKRTNRKRKNTTEPNETSVKKAKISTDVAVNPEVVKEESAATARELNITIKDIKDGGLDSQAEKGLLKPKEESRVETKTQPDVTPSKRRSERERRSSESIRSIKPRRSSARMQSPAQKEEVTTPTGASKPMDDQELAKTRKKSIMLAYSRLMSHKYSNAFQKPITNKQVPGYENVIYRPMDLHTIKKKIDNKQIGSVTEFQRDVLLMLNNAKMFNQTNSQVYNMAVEVEKDTLDHLQLTVKALSEGVLTDIEKIEEKIRKRQSMDSSKKDLKTKKRIKTSSSDAPPAKIIKLEENEDSENQSRST